MQYNDFDNASAQIKESKFLGVDLNVKRLYGKQ